MHSLVALYPPPEDLEAFRRHHTEVHPPLVLELLLDYEQVAPR